MKPTSKAQKPTKTELERQKEYADNLSSKGFGFDLVIGDAFIRGMRDIGYKHTGTALDEIIDNSIEAGAKTILVEFETENNGKKPTAIAVIDDGHGMPTDMLRASVMWGGTHRENSRKGIGRYGYGLPSASVSQGERFTVYSKLKDEDWYSVTIDLKDISAGKYTQDGRIITPKPKKSSLPAWVQGAIDKQFPKNSFKSGTVVIWEKLDRLTWSTISGLTGHLIEHFGLTYRNYLTNTKIVVDGNNVQSIDPLFITPGFRHYDLDDDIAEAMEPMRIPVKVSDGDERAIVNIRFASFPLRFGSIDKSKDAAGGNQNARWRIMNDHRGIVVSRMGRQIDVITRAPRIWKTVSTITQNNDRYWGVEIDFPAELDEEFSVTTSKQRVELTEKMWEILTQHGLERAIQSLRQRYEAERKKEKEKSEKGNEPRISEKVMAESEKFKHVIPGQTSEERERLSREAFEREVKRRKERQNKSEEQARQELNEDVTNRNYKIEFEDIVGGAFFRAEQIGPQFVIYINRKHSFYTALYASEDSNQKIKSALELMLFVVGQAEIDAIGNQDKRLFYVSERLVWSKNLDVALDLLNNVALLNSDEEGDKDSSEAA
jgi:hypothetical protein